MQLHSLLSVLSRNTLPSNENRDHVCHICYFIFKQKESCNFGGLQAEAHLPTPLKKG